MKGQDIRDKRIALGLSMEELAHRIGVSYTTLSRWELDKGKPSNMAIKLLKRILK